MAEGLPVETLKEALPFLRRPFTPAAVRWKVQSVLGAAKGALIVGYIDARLVGERLNMVAGGSWAAAYREAPDAKHLFCELAVLGTIRSDVGMSPKGFSKDLVSDAFKRAAVHFGVGVSLYAVPQVTIWMSASEKRIETRKTSKGETLVLTELGHQKLREGYAKWLTDERNTFGEPLDHGDFEDATGDPDAPGENDFTPEPAAPAVGAEDIVNELREWYAKLDPKPASWPAGKFEQVLRASWHSPVELQKLSDHLEGLR